MIVPFCGIRPQFRGFQPQEIHEIRGRHAIHHSNFIIFTVKSQKLILELIFRGAQKIFNFGKKSLDKEGQKVVQCLDRQTDDLFVPIGKRNGFFLFS